MSIDYMLGYMFGIVEILKWDVRGFVLNKFWFFKNKVF